MIVVTGGAGFIGSNIVRSLSERGMRVCLVDFTDAPGRIRNLRGLRPSDDIDPSTFLSLVGKRDSSLRGVEAVVHQGACTDTTERDIALLERYNVEYPKALAAWCLGERIPFLYASSAAVYGRGPVFTEDPTNEAPLNAYATSKRDFDRFVRTTLPRARSPVIGLRYFNVYGPGEAHKGQMASVVQQFHEQVRTTGTLSLFGASDGCERGEQRRDFVHVEDVVAVNLWFLEHLGPSGIFNVGTGRSRTFLELANLIVQAEGTGTVAYRPFPDHLRGAYQNFTEADLGALRRTGCLHRFRSLEDGVPPYVENLVAQDVEPGEGDAHPSRHP